MEYPIVKICSFIYEGKKASEHLDYYKMQTNIKQLKRYTLKYCTHITSNILRVARIIPINEKEQEFL